MRNKSAILSMLAISSMMFAQSSNHGIALDTVKVDKEPPIPKGCQKYTYYGITVIAISAKSAKKKCAKLLKVSK